MTTCFVCGEKFALTSAAIKHLIGEHLPHHDKEWLTKGDWRLCWCGADYTAMNDGAFVTHCVRVNAIAAGKFTNGRPRKGWTAIKQHWFACAMGVNK